MSDQGKWWKLWTSALDDHDLENMSIHEWFCWVRFGAYLKGHGNDGSIRLEEPCRSIQNLFRVNSFKEVIEMLMRFPNYMLSDAEIRWPHGYSREPLCEGQILWGRRVAERGVTTPHEEMGKSVLERRYIFVSPFNWNKYQCDKSTKRVRAFREKRGVDETANVTAQEEKRSRREEKRREDITPSAPKSAVAELVALFHLKLTEALGEKPPHFNGGSLGRTLKAALATHPVEDVKGRIENYFRSTDPFIVANGYSPTMFGSKFPILKGGPIHAIDKRSPGGSSQSPQAPAGKYAQITEN